MRQLAIPLLHIGVALTCLAIFFVFKKPLGPSPFFLPVLLIAVLTGQACLLGIWFAYSNRRFWFRLTGFSVGLVAIVFASVSTVSNSYPIRDRLGLIIELLAIPAIGVSE